MGYRIKCDKDGYNIHNPDGDIPQGALDFLEYLLKKRYKKEDNESSYNRK